MGVKIHYSDPISSQSIGNSHWCSHVSHIRKILCTSITLPVAIYTECCYTQSQEQWVQTAWYFKRRRTCSLDFTFLSYFVFLTVYSLSCTYVFRTLCSVKSSPLPPPPPPPPPPPSLNYGNIFIKLVLPRCMYTRTCTRTRTRTHKFL